MHERERTSDGTQEVHGPFRAISPHPSVSTLHRPTISHTRVALTAATPRVFRQLGNTLVVLYLELAAGVSSRGLRISWIYPVRCPSARAPHSWCGFNPAAFVSSIHVSDLALERHGRRCRQPHTPIRPYASSLPVSARALFKYPQANTMLAACIHGLQSARRRSVRRALIRSPCISRDSPRVYSLLRPVRLVVTR
ncbi:hypothetical protein PYCCODRAFT_1141872 [Trametes coccinea BRFM310]|uniref:Uncharacterized protein n=1 Tax=Trametes coccinea (strain BRFM310) TaxID=1353009 RepID=A0A1Y2I9N7_TRAC3|nr:hypothetical protein PYCCODRAFT_1265741 [Trametes coccinea BRFM310]OSC97403.1 hypothetical protein PYCCODRAFT_1141872 [Trametes coccinea BRFM310]